MYSEISRIRLFQDQGDHLCSFSAYLKTWRKQNLHIQTYRVINVKHDSEENEDVENWFFKKSRIS